MKQLTLLVWLIVSASMLHAVEVCDKSYSSFFNFSFNSEEANGASAEAAIINAYIELVDQVLKRLNDNEQQNYLVDLSTDLFAKLKNYRPEDISAYGELQSDELQLLIKNGNADFDIDPIRLQDLIRLKLQEKLKENIQEEKIEVAVKESTIKVKTPFVKFKAHSGQVNGVATLTETEFVTVGEQGEVLLWDRLMPDQEPLKFVGHKGSVRGVAKLSETEFVTVGDKGEVFVWDRANPKQVPVEFKGHTDWVIGVAKLTETTFVTVGGNRGEVFVWDRAKPNQEPVQFKGHPARALGVAKLTESKFVTVGQYGEVFVWDLSNPNQKPVKLKGHTGSAHAVAKLSETTFVTVGGTSGNGEVFIWDMPKPYQNPLFFWERFKPRRKPVQFKGLEHQVYGVAKIYETKIVTVGYDKEVFVWDLLDLNQEPLKLKAHTNTWFTGVIALNETEFVAVSMSGEIYIWDLSFWRNP